MLSAETEAHPARWASFLVFLAGLWLFVSPWIFGGGGKAVTWNSMIIGALTAILALIRIKHPLSTAKSWLNSAFGIWIFISPWIFGYSTRQFVNSLCIGVIVFSVAIIAANLQRMSHDLNSTVTGDCD